MHRNIVIAGGGYGGALAAARIARRGFPVTLIDKSPGFVERIRAHQVAAGDDIPPIDFRRLFRGLPVDFLQARVTGIDRHEKLVRTTEGNVEYDRLVYALGSDIETPRGAMSVANPLALRDRLRKARSALIVGGGLTGIETAAEIAERHPNLAVMIADRGKIGDDLSKRAARHLRDWFRSHRVTLFEETQIDEPEELESDVVVWCASFDVPSIPWDGGLRVNPRGQIEVDESLRSSDPSIYAIGDAASSRNRRMSCALALPMGAYVADVLTGATTEPFRFRFAIRCISLGRNDGIIQFVNGDDSPREKAITGRPAAWVKELICRYALMAVRLETRGVHYGWPKEEQAA
jgi:NADH dehydrogenase FAD-containing subunit